MARMQDAHEALMTQRADVDVEAAQRHRAIALKEKEVGLVLVDYRPPRSVLQTDASFERYWSCPSRQRANWLKRMRLIVSYVTKFVSVRPVDVLTRSNALPMHISGIFSKVCAVPMQQILLFILKFPNFLQTE